MSFCQILLVRRRSAFLTYSGNKVVGEQRRTQHRKHRLSIGKRVIFYRKRILNINIFVD